MRLALVVMAVVLSSCVTINGSSYDFLERSRSSVQLASAAEIETMHKAFASRGFPLADRIDRPGGHTIFKYKGTRLAVTTVSSSGGGTYTNVSSSTASVGSVFFAFVDPGPSGSFQVSFYGKPSVDQKEVCGENEPEDLSCETVHEGIMWGGLNQTKGREEADAIRGVLVEISGAAHLPAAPAPAAPVPATPTTPPPPAG